MPSEIDHIDELIEEYADRETELLDTLTSMREGEGSEDDDDEEDEDVEQQSNTLPANDVPAESVENKDKDDTATIGSTTNKTTPQDRIVGALGVIADEELSEVTDKQQKQLLAQQEQLNKEKEDEEKKKKRRRRLWIIIIVILILILLVVVAVALVLLLGRNNEADPVEEEDYSRDTPSKPPGDALPITSKYNDGYDPNDKPSVCNSYIEENVQQLGIRNLQGNYPLVSIDGTQAVVSTGSGYIAFFTLQGMSWVQNQVFEIKSGQEVSSVAISGNTAVVGVPNAFTTNSVDDNVDVELETGAIYIYEKKEEQQQQDDGSTASAAAGGGGGGKWQQLPGAYIPNEYKKITSSSSSDDEEYVNSAFGSSVAIHKDLIVASAPQENDKRGSITVFHYKQDENDWVQLKHVTAPTTLCYPSNFGYSVSIYNDIIAASADCDTNILLYQIYRSNGLINLVLTQRLPFVSASYGAISSISMNWDNLIYTTVFGGLFYYNKQTLDTGGTVRYFRSQEMAFTTINGLYDYPLSVDANMVVLSLGNFVYLYTQNKQSKVWKRESLVLENEGTYAGYVGGSVSISEGNLLVASDREVSSYDFTDCSRESSAPTPAPSLSPTGVPTETPGAPTCIYVNLQFDKYPQDTSWNIQQMGDEFVVAQSPAFDEELKDYVSRVCLPTGNFIFTMFDVYNDGMCCEWGDGSYNVTSEDGYLITKGGAFGESDSTAFSMPYDPRSPFVETDQPTRKPTLDPTISSNTTTTITEGPSPVQPPKEATTIAAPSSSSILASSSSPTPSPAVATPSDDCDGHTLDISVTLDQYPQDTRWEIIQVQKKEEVLVASSDPYDESLALTPVTQTVCLPDGTYDFIIYDVYSDGM